MGSKVVAPGLQGTGSIVVAHRLSGSTAGGIFLAQGSNHVSCISRQITHHWPSQEGLELIQPFQPELLLCLYPKSYRKLVECFKLRTDMIRFMSEKQPFLAAGQGTDWTQGGQSGILSGGLSGIMKTGLEWWLWRWSQVGGLETC